MRCATGPIPKLETWLGYERKLLRRLAPHWWTRASLRNSLSAIALKPTAEELDLPPATTS